MSIFWLGGEEKIVPDEEIKKEMYEDRIFVPGIIHGGDDYLIRVYLNDVCNEGDPDEFIVEYLTRDLILEAHEEDPDHADVFYSRLLEGAENFACYNDGSGDFATLIEVWPKSIKMSNSDLVDWAEGNPHGPKAAITAENVSHVLEEKINELYGFFQDANGITSGDISPMDAFHQENLMEQLAESITYVLLQELPCEEAEKKTPEADVSPNNAVWVYHEYDDAYAYGEQLIKCFKADEEKVAEAYLRKRVEEEYGCLWDDIPEDIKEDPHWVSFENGKGWNYFCLEKVNVE